MVLFDKLNPVALKLGTFELRWYAIFIFAGALFAFFFVRHFMVKDGYGGDLVDNMFFLAFPAGILGARIWWCISDAGSPWRRPDGNFLGIFTEWLDGGLAIQGGIVVGVAVGLLMIKLEKKTPLLYIFDKGMPSLLVAQAVGRWGNFMNREVYGRCISSEKLNFLPKFIQNQMAGEGINVSNGIACEIGQSAVPLFLVESVLNLLGFIILAFVLPKIWKKRKPGDIFPFYFIWYGVVRLILEPLRNPEFIMSGWGGGFFTASVVTSIVFIIGGIAWIVINRVFKLYEKIDKGTIPPEEMRRIKAEEENNA